MRIKHFLYKKFSFQEVHSRLDKYFFEAFVSGEDAWTAAVT